MFAVQELITIDYIHVNIAGNLYVQVTVQEDMQKNVKDIWANEYIFTSVKIQI